MVSQSCHNKFPQLDSLQQYKRILHSSGGQKTKSRPLQGHAPPSSLGVLPASSSFCGSWYALALGMPWPAVASLQSRTLTSHGPVFFLCCVMSYEDTSLGLGPTWKIRGDLIPRSSITSARTLFPNICRSCPIRAKGSPVAQRS